VGVLQSTEAAEVRAAVAVKEVLVNKERKRRELAAQEAARLRAEAEAPEREKREVEEKRKLQQRLREYAAAYIIQLDEDQKEKESATAAGTSSEGQVKQLVKETARMSARPSVPSKTPKAEPVVVKGREKVSREFAGISLSDGIVRRFANAAAWPVKPAGVRGHMRKSCPALAATTAKWAVHSTGTRWCRTRGRYRRLRRRKRDLRNCDGRRRCRWRRVIVMCR
jgi:hypothetical protein